ncbi:hypothetical protein K456DRAFT_1726842 [Colletotrichum gloeosporioides 23]|nr:hypothetical protein K456DRAFT_1726842 [Colletotrichum gloeosporioides 23]
MAQGLKGAPSTYARFGDLVFGHHDFEDRHVPSIMGYSPHIKTALFIYVDDHNVTSETFDDHFHYLANHYFPRIAWAPILLAPTKTILFADRLSTIRFEISGGKIRSSIKHREKFTR